MRPKSLLLFLAYLLSVSLYGQSVDALLRLKGFVRSQWEFNRLFPQEKVYLHFDNTGYFKGETIWFKAYVLRTDSMCYTNLSKVLYVELVSPTGDVIECKKLAVSDGQAHGDFSLERPMESGFYEIRAYTRYMLNWDSPGIFSRVFPIFIRTESPGNYAKMFLNKNSYLSRLPGYTDTKKEERLRETSVSFYPEGGTRVKGLESRIAFDVNDKPGDSLKIAGFLITEKGDTLETVRTLREGRGIFNCIGSEEALYFCMKDRYGKNRCFPLPSAVDTGCVMTLNTLNPRNLHIQVSGSASLEGELLGMAVSHNGNVVAFDTLRISPSPVLRIFSRSELPAGVNEVILFGKEGRIWADRLFFIAPDSLRDLSTISLMPQNTTISPYGKVSFQAKARPGSCFSLSVMDAATQTNGTDQNVVNWLLLSSDLKGFIRNPGYYLEADDAEHRLAADLLMMVQGWRRYDWKMMAGLSSFEKKQPIEDKLYLDGRLYPSNKKDDVENIELIATLYNPEGFSLKGETVTGKNGYYAFDLPDCSGEWTLLLNTKKNGEAKKFRVGIDRQFSPSCKLLSPFEAELIPVNEDDIVRLRKVERHDTDITKKAHQLKTAVVKGKRYDKNHTRAAWENEGMFAKSQAIYYNCDQYSDKLHDNGEQIPNVYEWLLKKDYFYKEVKINDRLVNWIESGQNTPTYVSNKFGHGNFTNPYEDVDLNLDDMRSLYIFMDIKVIGIGKSVNEISGNARKNAIFIFFTKHHTFWRKVKGLRRTFFQGYNEPRTFQMNNYDILPPEEDYRRTLYWAPDVKTDKTGNAVIEFWNNSSCEKMILSAESIWNDGTPAIYKNKMIQLKNN